MNILLKKIIEKRGIIAAIIIFIFIAALSKTVNELGVNYLARQQERENGLMVGAEPFFIQRDREVGVLLIHGFTSSSKDFQGLAEFLAEKNITVYVPLLPGHGTHPSDLKSTKYEEWVDVAQQSLDLLDTEKKFVLGYSMGGALALHLAAQNDLSGVISINAPMFLTSRYIPFIPLIKLVETYVAKNSEDIIQFIDEKRVAYDSVPLASITEMQKLISIIQLPSITEPVLIFQADNDRIVSLESADYIYNNIRSDNKELIFLSNSTHSKINNQQDAFNTVYEFILSNQ
ncbi:alpha/beta fold hydrolase [Candidatus Woesearchaeota archaeon]|nr:alpha/beta fold hydrolase [Candidatus Woesearchaeota archaeon]